DDAAHPAALCRRRQRDDRAAARGGCGAAQEIDLAADRADEAPAEALAIHLAGEIGLDRRVDGGEARQLPQHLMAMGVAGRHQLEMAIAMREIEEAPRAEEQPAD